MKLIPKTFNRMMKYDPAAARYNKRKRFIIYTIECLWCVALVPAGGINSTLQPSIDDRMEKLKPQQTLKIVSNFLLISCESMCVFAL